MSSQQGGLLRGLGPFTAMAVVVGTVIGSGIFKKPQLVAENAPFAGVAAGVWILGGLLALLGALSLSEVAVLFPRAGGNYVYLREAFGTLFGFLWAWVDFGIIRAASLAALATVFSESVQDILNNEAVQQLQGHSIGGALQAYWAQKGLTVGVIVFLGLINGLGVKWGGFTQFFITAVKVGSLVALVALPFVVLNMASAPTISLPQTQNLEPWWPSTASEIRIGALGTALLGVLWAYHGWMNIAPVAEEIDAPKRNIPIALIGGVTIVIGLYLGVNFAYALVLPSAQMAQVKDTTVATVFCLRLLGPVGAAVASGAVMCSVFGALNGNLLVGPRVLYAVSADGLAPQLLSHIHSRFRTPAIAIVVLATWSSVLVIAAATLARLQVPLIRIGWWTVDLNLPQRKPVFDLMTDFAMFGAVIFETLAVATIFIFRRKFPVADRPYRCPGYPVVPAVYVLTLMCVLISMLVQQPIESTIGVVFIIIGAVVYQIISRKLSVSGKVVPPERRTETLHQTK